MKYYLVYFCLFFSLTIDAQLKMSGTVTNIEDETLYGATVVLLTFEDSIMISFSLTNESGYFELEDFETGDYVLQVSYVGYSNYSQKIEVQAGDKNITVPTIKLNASTSILEEITIAAEHIPMGIRGDTISYNASAFKTRPNAKVEDLLKKLPGIEVERNGNIKAQGEDVDNVLVDGKSFFGDDPTMATKNLEAEAVDKVEVYDKLSEVAEFTGIDDGQEEKTINLKLKEEYKKGGFGTVDIAGGTNDRNDNRINYFRFSPSLQASVIGATNNINKETFTIDDRIEFLGGIGNFMAGGGVDLSNVSMLSDGINKSTSFGTNLNYDFNSKYKWTSHYLQTRNKNDLLQFGENESLTDINTFSRIDTLNANSSNVGHQVNTKLVVKASPFFNVIFKNNLDWENTNSFRNSSGNFLQNNQFVGSNRSSLTTLTDDFRFNSEVILKNKLSTKGRNLLTAFKYTNGNENIEEFVMNKNGVLANNLDLYQNQKYLNDKKQLDFNTNYTEPIGEKLFLSLSLAARKNEETPSRSFFDIVDNGEVFNTDLSLDYTSKYHHYLSGVSIRKNINRIKLSGGVNYQVTQLAADINDELNVVNNDYKNILPHLNFDYKLRGGKHFRMNYTTNIIAPRLSQLLPIRDNSSPNFVYVGNTNLVPEYRHNVNLSFSLFDNFNFTNLWASLRISQSKNRIVNKISIDENLFQTIEPLNADNYFSIDGYTSFSRPFKLLGIIYKIRMNARLSNYDSFINENASAVQDNNYDLRLSINNRKTDFVNIETGIALNYNTREYGINPLFNQDFFNTDVFLDLDIYLSKTWTLRSEFNYRNFSDGGLSDSPNYALWSASISKLLFNDKLEMRLSVFDILNQNIGFRRYGDVNTFSQMQFNNLEQYFLLGITYKIGRAKKDDGVKIAFD